MQKVESIMEPVVVVSSETIAGMAKRINADLEKLPLHTHGTVLNMVNMLAQHREQTVKLINEEKKVRIYENQVQMAEKERLRQEAEADKRIITVP